ncbi:MAG: 50S ribosomal protein L13, partial [Candidatus Portnoybacteria bacterium CG10_big_fil_rev_8_21_14_0_10_36_7]
SNYLGGIKETKMEDLMKNRPEEVVKRAVWGMLPKNRLRERMMTRLKLFGGQIK